NAGPARAAGLCQRAAAVRAGGAAALVDLHAGGVLDLFRRLHPVAAGLVRRTHASVAPSSGAPDPRPDSLVYMVRGALWRAVRRLPAGSAAPGPGSMELAEPAARAFHPGHRRCAGLAGPPALACRWAAGGDRALHLPDLGRPVWRIGVFHPGGGVAGALPAPLHLTEQSHGGKTDQSGATP